MFSIRLGISYDKELATKCYKINHYKVLYSNYKVIENNTQRQVKVHAVRKKRCEHRWSFDTDTLIDKKGIYVAKKSVYRPVLAPISRLQSNRIKLKLNFLCGLKRWPGLNFSVQN